jgi:phosphatidylglycerol lysyltransferase
MEKKQAHPDRNPSRQKIAVLSRSNLKIFLQFALTALFISFAVWFFNHEKTELHDVGKVFTQANTAWIMAGLMLVLTYILLQGLMYISAFAAVNAKVNLWDAVILFLKRNFISVFIPAGGISSLAFFGNTIEKKGVARSQLYLASSIYAFVGIVSVVIVALPAFVFAVSGNNGGPDKWYAVAAAILLLLLMYGLYKSIMGKKAAYRLLVKIYPDADALIDEAVNNKIVTRYFLITILVSVFIEFAGIAHVYISMAALNLTPSLPTAIVAYIIMVLFLIISPFLRGLGAIEVSMSYILIHAGYGNADAVAITLLFRMFEFWMPLLAGIISFILKIGKLLGRILPAFLIFALGIVNIFSVLSPGVPEKLQVLRDYLFFDVVNFSNGFVLITGILLLFTAAFMLRGLRMSWWFAVILTLFSVIGHITRGINYIEASAAAIIFFILLSTRKDYYVKTNPAVRTMGVQTALMTIAAVLVYGIAGFYLLDKKHFQIDFSILQSVKYTLLNFSLLGSPDLIPRDQFALDFLYTIRISGFASLAFLIFSLIRPYIFRNRTEPEEMEQAKNILRQYGKSALDYFKLYYDKQIFLSSDRNAFISYKVAGNFAVALEDPVAPDNDAMKKIIMEFRRFCYENGLKEIYYRVPQESLDIYGSIARKSLFLGQEGVVDMSVFTLEGGDRKSIRNAINKIADQGYTTQIHTPPIKDGLIQKLKAVSDDWLKSTGRKEITFSQGVFSEKEIKQQTVITVENSEEKIIAFLNIIPDYGRNEGTYDLMRKTADAPNGIMDYLLVELFKYFKSQGIQYVNIGMAPLSGLEEPQKFTERSMKFAYEKIRSFSHYKGQREYKEKFRPVWYNKYLIYDNDYDLFSVPAVLRRIIKA